MWPVIIQGGMGMGVSNWRLARTVSMLGQLGVVSGTAMDSILARRLQDGDIGGHMRRALHHFPIPSVSARILSQYYIPGGKPKNQPYRAVPMFSLTPSAEVFALSVAANFVEVYLAKEGHRGVIGINLLHKIHLPNPSSLYGAMLAGVDYVLMGAGIPRDIPSLLDRLARHEPVEVKIHVEGAAPAEEHFLRFYPETLTKNILLPPLKRPSFLAIIASATLAMALAKKSNGGVNGFIVEGPLAGGHNAPPRGTLQLNERGEPLYGSRDEVDLEKVRALGLPFWLAGSFAEPKRLQDALHQGAAGIQVGTAFAFCRESGLTEPIKRATLENAREGKLDIFTDPLASPTGFPFKLLRLEGSLAEPLDYAKRGRLCDLGYLRTPYKREDGTLGYRCPSEPPKSFAHKGGNIQETIGRKCLCNGLLSDIGLAQLREGGYLEQPLVTSGEDAKGLTRFLRDGQNSYSAKDVVSFILERK